MAEAAQKGVETAKDSDLSVGDRVSAGKHKNVDFQYRRKTNIVVVVFFSFYDQVSMP